MKERLQKLISARGLASRRKAEEWIAAGRVCVNGRPAALGDSADPEADDILVDGKPLPERNRSVYLMLHKPRGYVTTLSDERGRKDVARLVKDCPQRVYPIGRLDQDSEGLLLFTNDGAFANALMHPRHQVDKTYLVWVTGYGPGKEGLLEEPLVLDGYRIRPPGVRLLEASGQKACLENHHSRGPEPADPPDVRGPGHDRDQAQTHPGRGTGAGESGAGSLALLNGGGSEKNPSPGRAKPRRLS